jgi:hypothetical protein
MAKVQDSYRDLDLVALTIKHPFLEDGPSGKVTSIYLDIHGR